MSAHTSAPDTQSQHENQTGIVLAEQLLEFANESFVFSDAERVRSTAPPAQPVKRFPAPPRAYFTDVTPPPLSLYHLRNTRVVPSRGHILPFLPKGGFCLEINPNTGQFSQEILSILKPAKLHICDRDFNSFDESPFAMGIEQGIVELHEGDAAEFIAGQPDRHFDLICIHANHSYSAAARALEQAGRKIKENGCIFCANYTSYSPLEGIKYGVARAINEFCHTGGVEISYLALNALGYHDAVLRKCAEPTCHDHADGACLEAPDTYTFLPDVWEYLIDKYGIQSVLDVGAGAGWSTKWFADRGVYALGVERWKDALQRSQCRPNIIEHDYSTGPFVPSMVLDLAWSAGFVEQIAEEHIPNFMASFQCCKYVCLTHAEPGPHTEHLVNCQPTDYWIKKMREFGFDYDAEETARLRSTDKHKAPRGRKSLTFFTKRK